MAAAIPVAMGGAAVGYAGGQGWLAKLPKIGGSRMFTLGLVGWAAMKFSRNRYLRTAGLAAVAASAFHFGLSQTAKKTIEGEVVEGDVEGEDGY